jgi:hypothetical protein
MGDSNADGFCPDLPQALQGSDVAFKLPVVLIRKIVQRPLDCKVWLNMIKRRAVRPARLPAAYSARAGWTFNQCRSLAGFAARAFRVFRGRLVSWAIYKEAPDPSSLGY